jgi:hypothetical protein
MSKQKQRWSDLSERQQGAIVAAGAVQVGLLAAALYDIRRRPAREINGSKSLWTAAAFVNFAGPIAYFAFGRKR